MILLFKPVYADTGFVVPKLSSLFSLDFSATELTAASVSAENTLYFFVVKINELVDKDEAESE